MDSQHTQCIHAAQAEKESRAKEAKREVSRIQMEAESRKQQLRAEAEAQKRAAAAAQKEDAARTAQERMQQLQNQWRESEALKQVLPHGCQALYWSSVLAFPALTAAFIKYHTSRLHTFEKSHVRAAITISDQALQLPNSPHSFAAAHALMWCIAQAGC